jgi:hypothetical protein
MSLTAESTFEGELRGRGGDAKCAVRRSPDGDYYINNVVPPLPDGHYALLVNGLILKVRRANGTWTRVEN